MKTISAFVIAFIISIVNSYSQDIAGDWSGKTKRGDKFITFVFKIKQENTKHNNLYNYCFTPT